MRVIGEKGRARYASEEFRAAMSQRSNRDAISAALREKWKDPEFRKKHTGPRGEGFYATQPDDAVKLPPGTLDEPKL